MLMAKPINRGHTSQLALYTTSR